MRHKKKINRGGFKVNEPPDLQGKTHTAKLNLCVFNNSIKRVKGRAALFTVDKNIYISNGQLIFYGLCCRQHS